VNQSFGRWMRGVGVAAMALIVAGAPSIASAEGPKDKPAASKDAGGKGAKAARRGDKMDKKGRKGGALKAAKAYLQGNRRLADAYMLTGSYGKAVHHFEAIIGYTPDPKKLGAAAEEAGGDEGRGAKGRKGGDRGPKGRLHRVKLEAYMGAAACSWKMGDKAGAKKFAEAGLAYADTHHLDRATERFERFLADPAAGAERVAPDAEKLETELDAARKDLP